MREFIEMFGGITLSQQKKIDELEERLAKLEEILKGVQLLRSNFTQCIRK